MRYPASASTLIPPAAAATRSGAPPLSASIIRVAFSGVSAIGLPALLRCCLSPREGDALRLRTPPFRLTTPGTSGAGARSSEVSLRGTAVRAHRQIEKRPRLFNGGATHRASAPRDDLPTPGRVTMRFFRARLDDMLLTRRLAACAEDLRLFPRRKNHARIVCHA